MAVGALTRCPLFHLVFDLKASQMDTQHNLFWEFMFYLFELNDNIAEAWQKVNPTASSRFLKKCHSTARTRSDIGFRGCGPSHMANPAWSTESLRQSLHLVVLCCSSTSLLQQKASETAELYIGKYCKTHPSKTRWNPLSSSSCRATSTDLPNPLPLPFSIVHRSWWVFKATSCIGTDLLYRDL